MKHAAAYGEYLPTRTWSHWKTVSFLWHV